jgi:EAL domain-containing protein (putative c-di-GMP-specific phosphodiesterase class I)
MDASAMRTLTLEAAIRGALDNREFAVVYQPIIDTRTQRPIAVEALMRWHSPVHGTVPPDHFIPLLEENGMIVPVSRWALRQALRQVRTLQCAGQPALRLAFNLSSRQFRDVELLQDVTAALDEAGFDPTLLELELTERPHGQPGRLCRRAGSPARTGHPGRGGRLRHRLLIPRLPDALPVRTLKIDRSFVYQMERSKEAATIVRAIASLARSLGLELIGEGVENVGQLALLQEVGCHQVQGFLFSRPVTGAELALSFPH